VLVSPARLAAAGLVPGQPVTLTGGSGSVTLPVAVADLPDDVVWAPTTARWGAVTGTVVHLAPAAPAAAAEGTLA
jgi:NADH-quinone oxidoreductase subunit G